MAQKESESPSRPYVHHLQYAGHSLGYITGRTCSDGKSSMPAWHFFGGVPYGMPPVGKNRFRPPRPIDACYTYGAEAAPLDVQDSVVLLPTVDQSGSNNAVQWERGCLECNIWVPAGKAPDHGWPVVVHIHDLQSQSATTAEQAYASPFEAPASSILVVPGYRVGVFADLACEGLHEEERPTERGSTGSYGFLDQRLALKWTRNRIGYFGGDASNIALSGTFATIYRHLNMEMSSPSERIVHRVMIRPTSPTSQSAQSFANRTQPAYFEKVLSALRIPTNMPSSEQLSILRFRPADEVWNAASSLSFTVSDEKVIDIDAFMETLRENKIQAVHGQPPDSQASKAGRISSTL